VGRSLKISCRHEGIGLKNEVSENYKITAYEKTFYEKNNHKATKSTEIMSKGHEDNLELKVYVARRLIRGLKLLHYRK